MRKPLIYIASPYRQGNLQDNIRASLFAAEVLVQKGYSPIPPLLNHHWQDQYHHTQEFWLGYDLDVLVKCDALVRLPGSSVGADGEVRFAEEQNIPIYYGLSNVPEV